MTDPEQILAFWFPPGLDRDAAAHRRQLDWWFRGESDRAVSERFLPALEAARRGALDSWASAPRSRLALIIVLDQFSRSAYRDTAEAYAQDGKALGLALDGLERGFYDRLAAVWERMFFTMPLSHSERLDLHERNVALAEALVEAAPAHLRDIYVFSAEQARGHRDVVRRFGRHPHRNAILGRVSTPAELAYLAAGDFVHRRSMPPAAPGGA
ncbi:MAG TPA: DUF924 family protein [Dongiaceae bacterium]|nr:DUF924 family protein [Dongiaceae bacterium]